MAGFKEIDGEATYFFTEVVKNGWLGSRSQFMCKRILIENQQVLNPKFAGQGRATRIMLSGADIINYRSILRS